MRVRVGMIMLTLCPLIAAEGAIAGDFGRHALLVGVSRYPSLGPRYQLVGPSNDVLLMRDLLVEKLGFASTEICILSEEAGAANSALLPTRANIERQFARLAETVHSGDYVVVFMAGHGAQQPEPPGSEREPDGLDEIFLPRDVANWQGDTLSGKVPNAIIDDELGRWLSAIRAKNTRIWAIFDCCHSGDITRGFGERERFVPPGDPEGLGIPVEAITAARRRSATHPDQRTLGAVKRPLVPTPIELDLEGLVVLYACQPHEKAIERDLPDSIVGKPHGLLTYSLNAVLAQTGRALSYSELAKRIHLMYVQLGRTTGPTPVIEGETRQRVGDNKLLPHRPMIVSRTADGRGLQVDAGRLHGLTTGSILAIYPPPSEQQAREAVRPIGHVRVARSEIASAVVEPYADGTTAAPETSTLVGGRAEVVEVDYGSMQLRVALDRHPPEQSPVPPEILGQLRHHLTVIAGRKNSLIQLVEHAHEAEWFVRYQAGNVFLVPAARWSSAVPIHDLGTATDQPSPSASPDRLFGPFRLDESLPDALNGSLLRIARAENLLKLAAQRRGTAADGDFGVQMDVELRRLNDAFDSKGLPLTPPIRMHPGELVQYVVRNSGSTPFDLTVLYVDSCYGIAALFPIGGVNNRWQPGEAKRLPVVEVTGNTLGREHIVFVAVSARGPNVEFTNLEQPGLQKHRDVEPGGGSPLAQLLEKALYGDGQRSVASPRLESFQLEVIPIEVVPADPHR